MKIQELNVDTMDYPYVRECLFEMELVSFMSI